MRPLLRFMPPLAWMGVIALLSSDLFAADATGAWLFPLLGRLLPWAGPGLLHGLHAILRKMGHLVEYGILAALWLRALGPPPGPDAGGLRRGPSDRRPLGRRARLPRGATGAVGLSALYAVVDEARQGLTATRTPSALDVAIDTAGALVAVACLQGHGRVALAGVRLLRWAALVAASGSLAAALVDWSLGLPVWDLALAALGAGIAAWALGRLEGGWRRAGET